MAFDNRVSQAIDIIYVKKDFRRGQEAFDLLESAYKDGDGDAAFMLGRCYAGSGFVDVRFNYVEDFNRTEELFNESIEAGSAMGMFAARRLGDFHPRCGSFVHAPYTSDREVWDAVVNEALSGELFCQLLVANAYYYNDAITFLEIDFASLSQASQQHLLHTFAITARDMYEDLFDKGMIMAYGNYKDIITSGDYGVPVSKKRYKRLRKICSSRGISI